MPAALVEALKRSTMANAAPGAMPPGGMPLNGRPGMAGPQPMAPAPVHMGPDLAPPGVSAMGVPSAPMRPPSLPPAPPAPTPTDANGFRPFMPKVPPVTDDPAVVGNGNSNMGAMPKTPDLASYLNPALKQYQGDLAGYQHADQANRIDPQQVKPRLWERLVGFGLGATQLKDPQNAGAVAGEVVNRRLNAAEQGRSNALAPWTQRLQMDKEGMPLATAAADVADKQARINLDTAKENRERYTAISNSEYKDALASIRDEVAKGNIDKANDLLDQRQKELEEKKDHDAEWFQMQHALLDLREKIADKGKDHTAQTMGAETQKANALREADRAFDRAYAAENFPGPKEPWTDSQRARLAELEQQRDDAKQGGEDAYEAKSSELKGAPVEHQDVSSWRSKPAGNSSSSAAPASNAKPVNDTSSAGAVPTATGPKGETPVKTANDGKVKIGFYKSTGQWMVVPQTQVPTSGGK
jgi:hypothetical protein